VLIISTPHDLPELLATSVKNAEKDNKATVFGYYVKDAGNVTSLEEKPSEPKSNYAVIGLYFYPNDVIKKAHNVKPSDRGELEITTLNQDYLQENRQGLKVGGAIIVKLIGRMTDA